MNMKYLKTVWTLLFHTPYHDLVTPVFDLAGEHEYQRGLHFEQLALCEHYHVFMQKNVLQMAAPVQIDHSPMSSSNSRNAMWYFLRSALRGHPEAEFKMGIGYLNGQLGLDRNYDKAEQWLKKAAQDGHPDAKRCLYDAYSELAFS
ncbi:sel1 repeat family protein [Acinetobacter tandoii]|uniref:tetratricopeptide repeat protein n=1 Tax=Acinetobacter tandoii TaxID=202954 RepID=UPI00301621DE